MNEMFKDYPDILTVQQMQDVLQIGRSWAYKLLEENEVQHFRIGRSIKIPKTALIAYVKRVSGVTFEAEICYNNNVMEGFNLSVIERGTLK